MIQSVMAAVTVAIAAAMFTGCEDRNTGANITVTPQSTTLAGRGSVALTVEDPDGTLVYPLKWSVSNSALGAVVGTGGGTAVYEGNGNIGTQSVTVWDDTGMEGVAVIEQT